MKRKTVVLAGARGLIGQSTGNYLRARGHAVLELDLELGNDLSDEAFVKSWFLTHPADALVNLFARNHHISIEMPSTSYLDIELDSLDDYFHINVTTLFSTCREFIRNNETGVIVNASSIYGRQSPRPALYGDSHKHPGYGSSKAAVIALTQYLAVHSAPNFRVNCLLIGGIENSQPPAFITRYKKRTPLERMAKVSEIPPLIEFLLSDKSSYMTGGAIPIDGGWTA